MDQQSTPRPPGRGGIWSPALPAGWVLRGDEFDFLPGVRVWTGPAHQGFAPSIVVAHGPQPTALTPQAWDALNLDQLRDRLVEYHLIDELPATVAGNPAALRVGVHVESGESLTFMQWSWLTGSVATTVTCTSRTWEIAQHAPTFAAMVHHGHEIPA